MLCVTLDGHILIQWVFMMDVIRRVVSVLWPKLLGTNRRRRRNGREGKGRVFYGRNFLGTNRRRRRKAFTLFLSFQPRGNCFLCVMTAFFSGSVYEIFPLWWSHLRYVPIL